MLGAVVLVALATFYGASRASGWPIVLAAVLVVGLFLVSLWMFAQTWRRREKDLRYYTLHDPLTSLPNRSSFLEQVESALGEAARESRYAHSVHHVVTGLRPNTHYWYRFSYGGYSVTGRTLTAGNRDDVRFAFANCQNLQEGFYPVYRDIAEDGSLDLVVYLGDYIYYSAPAPGGPRKHRTKAPVDLASFRNRHADYKMDRETSRPRMRRIPGSSPGTTTRSRTTTRVVLPSTTRPPSRAGGRAPTRPTTSTCRSRPTSCNPGPSTK